MAKRIRGLTAVIYKQTGSVSVIQSVLMKQMRLRYAGACRLCGASLPAGTEAIYESETKTVRCLECATEATETTPDLEPPCDESLSTGSGVAGSSARREYERRKAKDEEKLREKWGRIRWPRSRPL
jgi:Fe-S cluster biogenesis protein NfuA